MKSKVHTSRFMGYQNCVLASKNFIGDKSMEAIRTAAVKATVYIMGWHMFLIDASKLLND